MMDFGGELFRDANLAITAGAAAELAKVGATRGHTLGHIRDVMRRGCASILDEGGAACWHEIAWGRAGGETAPLFVWVVNAPEERTISVRTAEEEDRRRLDACRTLLDRPDVMAELGLGEAEVRARAADYEARLGAGVPRAEWN